MHLKAILLAILLCGISAMSAGIGHGGVSASSQAARSSEDAVSDDASSLPVWFTADSLSHEPPGFMSITLRGSPTFVALDNDGDSLANQLLLRVPLHVDVPGVYWFLLTSLRGNAFAPVNKYLDLSIGDAVVVIPVSGITLRSFTGNLSVALQVAFVTEFGWTYVLEWQGVYPIPDPTYFQSVPTVDVTVRVTGPPSTLFRATLVFWNASNAYETTADIPVGFDITLSLPQLEYIVLAWTRDPFGSWEGLVRLHAPTVSTVGISTNPAGPVEDKTEIGFADWTRGEARSSRIFRATPSARFFADVTGDGNGMLTDSEIEVYTFWRVLEPAATPIIEVDGNTLSAGPWGPPAGLGRGPVVSDSDLGVVRSGSAVVGAPNAGPHRVQVGVANPRPGAVSVVTFVWPPGWILASTDSGFVASPIGGSVTRIEIGHEGTAASHLVNLTVVPVSDASGSIRGGLIEAPSRGTPDRPVVGATVQLFANGTLIAQAVSDSNGEFLLSPVPPGTYLLIVDAVGHEPTQKSVTVGPFQGVTVDQLALALTPASAVPGWTSFVLAGSAVAAGLVVLGVLCRRHRKRD